MKIFKERELELMEEFREQKKKEQKEKDQKRYQERKKAMEIPIDPLPVRELCEYEKIRKDNIFRSRRWGSSLPVCARLTVRSSPHRHERKFFGARVWGGGGRKF